MKLDSHQHFWRYDPKDYPWITDQLRRIRRDYLPADLWAELRGVEMDGSIVVQARQTLEESRWLLKLAAENAWIKGVVGWVDLRSERVSEQLEEFAKNPKFLGVRHVVQDESDDQFMLRKDFLRGLSTLKAFDLAYDLLIFPKHLPVAIQVVEQFPRQRFVLDHIAKPFIRSGTIEPWSQHIHRLAQFRNVFCKVSGMVTEANWGNWTESDFRPYLDVVFEAFGKERLMFGSDWPVCLLSGSYAQVHGIVNSYVTSAEDKARIFGLNASAFYGIESTRREKS